MNAVGITAEYDPLHNGHVYNLKEALRITGRDAAVVAMSGDYVQRGEPAILDKWTRTGLALESGADLVIEIPAAFCLADAGRYASASVRMLEALGCRNIAFGSECGNADLIRRVADAMSASGKRLSEEAARLARTGMNWPAARMEAYRKLMPGRRGIKEELAVLSSPNDILALEYVRNMKVAEPCAVLRVGSAHNSVQAGAGRFISASAIRGMIQSGQDVRDHVPACTARALAGCHVTDASEWWEILRYAILSSSADDIDDCPSGGEGLGSLIRSEVMKASSENDLIHRVKSKRYTYTRISRLCMQIVLGITRSMAGEDGPGYVRVLGFTEKGRELLAEIRDDDKSALRLPVITNINKEKEKLQPEAAAMLELDVHAADIYNLVTGRGISRYSDHRQSPVMRP